MLRILNRTEYLGMHISSLNKLEQFYQQNKVHSATTLLLTGVHVLSTLINFCTDVQLVEGLILKYTVLCDGNNLAPICTA